MIAKQSCKETGSARKISVSQRVDNEDWGLSAKIRFSKSSHHANSWRTM